MYRFLFSFIFVPIGCLPSPIFYALSDFLAWMLRVVFRYRKEIVLTNLQNAFPEKNPQEINILRKKAYTHLVDVFLEAFKMLTFSREQIMARYVCKNPEIINQYYDKKQSVVFISGHYNNWEYMVLSLGMQFFLHGIGVGKPLSNKKFGKVLNDYRTRYGTEVIDAGNVREKFDCYHREGLPCVYMMLNDQSPASPERCYWTRFLNQDTPVIFGPEYFAKKYNYPVYFYAVRKVKRGWYEFEISTISLDSLAEEKGVITEKSVKKLESLILENPAYWLWSHKRWKHAKQKPI